jgi:hypothetical protein
MKETPPAGPERSSTNYDERPFTQQPMFSWLGVQELARAGARVLFAERLTAFIDRREMEAALALPEHLFDADYRTRNDIWFDYTADVGDGFDPTYAVAWQMARPVEGTQTGFLPRPSFVVLGGDEVYPIASREEYWRRFHAPYRFAWPETAKDQRIDLFAIPGNHDWYDGLTNFIRLLSQERALGGWQTRQRRSYFAVQLPHDWYVWGIDVQLESYIDYPQLQHFKAVAQRMKDQSKTTPKLILCTAQPDWVHCGAQEFRHRTTMHSDHGAYRTLAFFQDHVIHQQGIALKLVLAGDLHHYARYTRDAKIIDQAPPHFITCGTGGAYLSATHNLPDVLTVALSTTKDRAVQTYKLRATYPTQRSSKSFARGVFWKIPTTLSFGLYAAIALVFVSTSSNVSLQIPAVFVCFLVITGALCVYARSERQPTWADTVWGVLHGITHTGAALGLASLFNAFNPPGLFRSWLLLIEMVAAGYLVGCLVFALYVWLASRLRGRHHNEVFAAQSRKTYKGFLRCYLDATGLHIHPVGIPDPPQDWTEASTGPRYQPKAPIRTEPMDETLHIT